MRKHDTEPDQTGHDQHAADPLQPTRIGGSRLSGQDEADAEDQAGQNGDKEHRGAPTKDAMFWPQCPGVDTTETDRG